MKLPTQNNETKLRHYIRLLERFVSGKYDAARYDKEFMTFIGTDETYFRSVPIPYTEEQTRLLEEMFLTSDCWTQELFEPEESYDIDTEEYLRRSREHLAKLKSLI